MWVSKWSDNMKPSKVFKDKRMSCGSLCPTVRKAGTSAASFKCTLASSYSAEAPPVDPGCTWHVVAQSNWRCIWFALAASIKLRPAHADKLRGESAVAGFLSLTQRAWASHSSISTPSHLLQLSNHLMTFKGAWHPFEVGEGALALVSCPNPTQPNKNACRSEANQRSSFSLNVKQTSLALSLILYFIYKALLPNAETALSACFVFNKSLCLLWLCLLQRL